MFKLTISKKKVKESSLCVKVYIFSFLLDSNIPNVAIKSDLSLNLRERYVEPKKTIIINIIIHFIMALNQV